MDSKLSQIEHFIALESCVWDALASGDMQADARMLSDAFLGVYETGFSGKLEHCRQLKNGPIVQNYKLCDARIIALSDSLVMLVYLAVWTRSGAAEGGDPEKMYISSLWQYSEGAWLNIFSQDTPVKK